MPAILTDPAKLEELSRAVETSDLSVEEFVRSLSLPEDERKSLMQTLEELPETAVSPTAMPSNPPMTLGWWK